jgi:hypothetical protein
MKRLYLFIMLIFLFCQTVWPQLAPGQWAYHLSMNNTSHVIEAGQKIYFLSEAGIYYFNKSDNSLETMTKLDGLSESDFNGIYYNEWTKSIVVTYKNSCIDVIREDGNIYPIVDIKRKNISGDKLIYNAENRDKFCYLSCGFGIVVFDLEKLEIKDSYIIGSAGNYLPVYDVAFIDGFIFAGTKEGIKYAPLEGANLLDFSSWKNADNIFLNNYNYDLLETGWNRLWAVHKSDEWWGDRTFSRHGNLNGDEIWYPEFDEYVLIRDFKFIRGNLIYCVDKPTVINEGGKEKVINHPSIEIYNEQKQKILKIDNYTNISRDGVDIKPLSTIIDEQGVVWIADENYGGIRYENGNFTRLTPQGPFNNYVFSLTYSDNQLWSTSGGRNYAWGNLEFDFNVNLLEDGKWQSFNRLIGTVDGKYRDAIQVLPFAGDPGHFYVSTWGRGILEFDDGKMIKAYDDQNSSSTLQNAVPEGGPYVRIGGMAFDSKGSLWVSNAEVSRNLHELKTDGTWKSYELPEIASDYSIGKILVTKDDDIWIIVPRNKTKGIYIMSNDGRKKVQHQVVSYFTNGKENKTTPMNDVYSIIEDNDGAIWVGTSNGIAVYNNPSDVFEESPYYANQPGVDRGDDIYHALLENITVTAIAVDGGNRKWCGSNSNGLFLISADGQHELEHFTTQNSDLISDNITSLAYDGKNGILYVGTQLGLVSYRTDSRDAYDKFDKVYAYPNPVRENYNGKIYITGLMSETNVKITTVSGRLVYETTSNGGEAVWDGNDLAGNRVHTGIYLAYCASSDGMQSAVTKILFIR